MTKLRRLFRREDEPKASRPEERTPVTPPVCRIVSVPPEDPVALYGRFLAAARLLQECREEP